MQIRGHGTAVAVVLSVLALAVAGGGTAVAVSSSVNIVDGTNAGQVAKVDVGGRLAVAGPVSAINGAGYVSGYQSTGTTVVLSPTATTIAISRIQLANPSANAGAAEQQLFLNRYSVTAAGTCDTSSGPILLAQYDLAPGDDIVDTFPEPIVLVPIARAKYCLAFSVNYLGSTTAIPTFYLSYGLTARVISGVYTGLGAGGPVRPMGSAKVGG